MLLFHAPPSASRYDNCSRTNKGPAMRNARPALHLLLAMAISLAWVANTAGAPNRNDDYRRAIEAINRKISTIKRELSGLDKNIEARMKHHTVLVFERTTK